MPEQTKSIWRLLTDLPVPPTGQGTRRQARLLASLLVVLVPLGTVLAVTKRLLVPGFGVTFATVLLGLFGLVGAYVLLRRGHYLWAAYLAVAATTAIPLINILLFPEDVAAAGFLVVPELLAGTLLPERVACALVAAVFASAVSALVYVGEGTLPTTHAGAVSMLLLSGVLIVVALRHRSRAEEDRRTVLAESEANFRALAENANDGILVAQDGHLVFANARLAAMVESDIPDMLGASYLDYLHPDDRARVAETHTRRLRGEVVPSHYEARLLTRSGRTLSVEVNAAVTNWHGAPAGLAAVRDISERIAAEAKRRQLSSALAQTADAIMITDPNSVIEYVNRAFEQTTGYRSEEVVGRPTSVLRSGRQGDEFYHGLWDSIRRGEVFNDVMINKRKDGSLYYEERTISPVRDDSGRITHFVATGRDITERMQAQERLEHLAHHDALTELPNRVLFLDRLKQALARARWHDRLVAVMFLDLDRFKQVNDSLGHEAGDELLRDISARMRASLRERDTIARLGGDEFAVLLDDVAHDADVSQLAQKVLDSLVEPFHLHDQEFFITASIGISQYPTDGTEASLILKNADIAMYKAKDLGRNNYQFYSTEMGTRAFERLTLETSLRRALEREEFRLHYQPQIDLETGGVLGFEALLRWQHPDLGLVPPADFIPVLEDSGLILPVGEWVLRTACRDAAELRQAIAAPFWISVNVSAHQIDEPGFPLLLERVLADTGHSPEALELEITESILMHNTGHAMDTLRDIHARGVRLAIDDFGTGYSSLSYLKRFPIDTVKIDRSFVRDVPEDAEDSAIVRSIVALADSLGLGLVAEGVETTAQLAFLREIGCEAIQGFLVSRPLPLDELIALLHDGLHIPAAPG